MISEIEKVEQPNHRNIGKYYGINPNRYSTDIWCFATIILCWIGMTAIGSSVSKNYDVNRLLGPIDSSGKVCGFEGSFKSEPLFYTVLTDGLGSCVNSCPNYNALLTSIDPNDYICLESLSDMQSNSSIFSSFLKLNCFTDNSYDLTKNCGCNIMRDTMNIFNRCRFADLSISDQYITQVNHFKVSFLTFNDLMILEYI